MLSGLQWGDSCCFLSSSASEMNSHSQIWLSVHHGWHVHPVMLLCSPVMFL